MTTSATPSRPSPPATDYSKFTSDQQAQLRAFRLACDQAAIARAAFVRERAVSARDQAAIARDQAKNEDDGQAENEHSTQLAQLRALEIQEIYAHLAQLAQLHALEIQDINEHSTQLADLRAIETQKIYTRRTRAHTRALRAITIEIPPATFATFKFPRLPKKQLKAIRETTFNPFDLYLLGSAQFLASPKSGTLLDLYGATPTTWSRAFMAYVKVMLYYFREKHPCLYLEMITFWEKIEDLAQFYDWSTAVLPLALSHHKEMYVAGVFDTKWFIPNDRVHDSCNPSTERHSPGTNS